jgi:hypothetical protein
VLVFNPIDEIDRPKVLTRFPKFLSLRNLKNFYLETAEEEVQELIPYLAMAGFAAARRRELSRKYVRFI